MVTFLKWIWLGLKGFVIIGAAFILGFILFGIAGALNQKPKVANVPENSALMLNMAGSLVEETSRVNPGDIFGNPLISDLPKEVRLRDIQDVLDAAASDKRITALVLNLETFLGGGPAALTRVGDAIEAFKESGKPVLAYGRFYSQSQYFLASFADTVWMGPAGSAYLTGYGSYPLFYRGLLEKIKATPHIFKVGEYKSAVEPYSRSTMSEEAKANAREFLDYLWNDYLARVAANRGLEPAVLKAFTDDPATAVRRNGNDYPETMKAMGLMDEIVDHPDWRRKAGPLLGEAERKDGFRSVDYGTYLKNLRDRQGDVKDDSLIAVVTARGTIIPGTSGPQSAASESITKLLRSAKKNDRVKAVILRVDSPGGSIFAAEQIRQEVLAIQAEGKPVIASYGSVSASGGVYISANADAIVAEPNTITGSIGIFAAFVTFENSAAEIGLTVDGVGTTPLAGGAGDFFRGVPPAWEGLLQASIEDGYQDFLRVVAEGRGTDIADIDPIARGRVWIGEKAHELGLVDHLGGLDKATEIAAKQAGIDDYTVVHIRKKPTEFEKLLEQFADSAQARALLSVTRPRGLVSDLYDSFRTQARALDLLQDPNHLYIQCELCDVRAK